MISNDSLLNHSENLLHAPQSSSLKGRKGIAGHRVTLGTVVPTSARVAAFVYLLLGATLITIAVLMSQGTITVADPMVTTGFQWAAGIVGALQVITIPLMIYFVRKEIKNREHNLKLLDHLPERPPQMPSSQSSQNSPLPIQLPPIPADEWQARIQTAQNVGKRDEYKFFNLSELNTPFKTLWGGIEYQIPWFGKKSGTIGSDSCLMAVKLPPQQIKRFPKRIASWFTKEKVTTQECYFMVFDNRLAYRTQNEWKDSKRNLALHGLALPEYNRKNPDVPDGNPTDVTRHSEIPRGISVDCKIALFEPKGIQVPIIKQIGNGSHGQGAASKTKLFVHNDKKTGYPMISYKKTDSSEAPQAEFEIEQDQFAVSSAYFAATFRGKGVAIHALILNDDQKDDGARLVTALEGQTLEDFLTPLTEQAYCSDVGNTFTLA